MSRDKVEILRKALEYIRELTYDTYIRALDKERPSTPEEKLWAWAKIQSVTMTALRETEEP